MEPVKILIVEDDGIIASTMKAALEKQGYIVTGIADSGELALEMVKDIVPGLVVMDIHLAGNFDGITTARTMKRLYPVPVIFITSNNDIEVFRTAKEVFPENYLVKPFSDRELIHAVELGLKNFMPEKDMPGGLEPEIDYLFIPAPDGGKVKLPFKEILYIESDRAYSNIYTANPLKSKSGEALKNPIKVSVNTTQLELQLNYKPIFRINKSTLVNTDKVDRITSASVFIGKEEIGIGAKFYTEALKKIFKLLKFE